MDNALIDRPAATQPDGAAQPRVAEGKAPARKFDARWAAMICLLLGVSGAFRYWRDFQFATIETRSKDCPFPLKELPMVVGGWRMVEGAEATLDPEIAQTAGSSEHLVRIYENQKTGEKATVLVLYGLAQLVWGHTPEVCYPATGYKALSNPRDVMVDAAGTPDKVPFRQGMYGLFQAGATSFHDVYYSFRNAGSWVPDMGSRWKQFRYNPGMFKIQVERVVKSADSPDNACLDLLGGLAAAIEARVEGASTAVASR